MKSADNNLLIWKRVDDEFSRAEAAELEAAMLESESLRDELAEAERFDALLSDAFSDPDLFGQALQLKIIDQINSEAQESSFQKTRQQPWYQIVAAVAAILLLVTAAQIQSGRDGNKIAVFSKAATALGHGLRVFRQNQWRELGTSQEVFFGESIQNLSREPIALSLVDGSKVTLKADCTLKINREADIISVDLDSKLGGEVFCKVKSGQGRFKVNSRHIAVTVIGTQFTVRSSKKSCFVGVVEGRVRCSTRGVTVNSSLLTGSQFIQVNDQQVVTRGLKEPSDFVAWLAAPERRAVEAVINSRPKALDHSDSPQKSGKGPTLELPGSQQKNPPSSMDSPVEPPKSH